jgi:molybdopterin adenylyltransferase
MQLKIGIINVSDRASKGIYEDLSGKKVVDLLLRFIQEPWEKVYSIVPDEQDQLEQQIISMADDESCDLIITTGGTGVGKRDVTPEATLAVCDKILPGFGEQMRMDGLKFVPTAIMSRQLAGIRNRTLIINLPGRSKAIEQCLRSVFPAIPYALDLIAGKRIRLNQNEVRPKTPRP